MADDTQQGATAPQDASAVPPVQPTPEPELVPGQTPQTPTPAATPTTPTPTPTPQTSAPQIAIPTMAQTTQAAKGLFDKIKDFFSGLFGKKEEAPGSTQATPPAPTDAPAPTDTPTTPPQA